MQIQIVHSKNSDQVRRISFGFTLLLIACCIKAITGCDDTFQPLQENNVYNFSISGYLDASADTQWVRVGTIRENIDEPPDPTGIMVTLENLQSGETVVMNDSVFTSRNVLNYWTTMEIKHEQTYRIIVEGADGETSRVTVTTPKKLPLPFIVVSGPPNGANIYVDAVVEHIADVQSVTYVIVKPGSEIRSRIYRFPIRNTLKFTYAFFGSYITTANHEKELDQIEQSIGGADYLIERRQVFIAAGGPEWNDSLSSIDDLEYFLDGTGSNVENGLGYVVGISSGWYRQVTCLTPDRSNFAPCPEEKPFWTHE